MKRGFETRAAAAAAVLPEAVTRYAREEEEMWEYWSQVRREGGGEGGRVCSLIHARRKLALFK